MTTWTLYLVWVTLAPAGFFYSATDIAGGFVSQTECVRAGHNVTNQVIWGNPRYPGSSNATFICDEREPEAKP